MLGEHPYRDVTYRLKSDNLKLVTVLECVSATGEVVPPLFCLQNGTVPDLHTLNDDQWGRCVYTSVCS